MNIFIAGGTGAIGRQLVPMLVEEGHDVVAMTRSPDGATRLEAMGATAVIGDVFDKKRLAELVEQAKPEIVIHQLTAFGATDADPLAETIRIRTEGTRNLVEAATKSNARRFIAQSISFICTPVASGDSSSRASRRRTRASDRLWQWYGRPCASLWMVLWAGNKLRSRRCYSRRNQEGANANGGNG